MPDLPVGQQDGALRVDQQHAVRADFEQVALALFALAQPIDQLACACLDPLAPAGERAHQCKQQCVGQQAERRDHQRLPTAHSLLECRCAGVTHGPGPAGQAQRLLLQITRLRRSGGSQVVRLIQQRLGAGSVAIVERVVDLQVPVPGYAGQHVFDAERAIDKTAQLGTPLLDTIELLIAPVDRKVHQEPRLCLLATFLHQSDFARKRAAPDLGRIFHRQPARRFRAHVVAEGAVTAPAVWLQIGDCTVALAVSCRMDSELGQAVGTHALLVSALVTSAEYGGIADSLDAGKTFVQPQRIDELAPFGARYLIVCGELPANTA